MNKKFRTEMDFIAAASTNLPEAPKDAVKPPPARSKPWDDANPKIKTAFAMRLPEAVHMKLQWLSENMPNASMHSIALQAIEDRVDALVKERDHG